MKVLFITTQFPYPLDNGGKIGAINGLELLRNDDVTLLSFCERPDLVQDGVSYLNKRFPNLRIENPVIHNIHIQRKPIKLAKAIASSFLGKCPYLVTKFWDRKMLRLIEEVFQGDDFDVIFVDYLNMQAYGDYVREKYRSRYNAYVLKDHNIEHEIVKQMAANAPLARKLILIPLWHKTKKYELDAIKKADIVLSVCDENAAYFRKYNPNSYSMKPAFEIIPTTPKRSQEGNAQLLYIGNLSWKPNMEGLTWFVEKVWPILKARNSETTLDVIGSGADKSPFADVQGVNWHGFVEDISAVYQDYDVFIVPLWSGSGIRIKILEAFNNEIAVVSTTVGCNTIGAEDGVHLLIADDAEQFANAVLHLLEDASFRKRMCAKAKEFFIENYSIESRVHEFSEIFVDAKGRNI